jgi:hypothetical protein
VNAGGDARGIGADRHRDGVDVRRQVNGPVAPWPRSLPCLVCSRPRKSTGPGDRIHERCRERTAGAVEIMAATPGKHIGLFRVPAPFRRAVDDETIRTLSGAQNRATVETRAGIAAGEDDPPVLGRAG